MDIFSSDELLAMSVPVIVYWAYSGLYMLLDPSKYRLHSQRDEDVKNLVSAVAVVKGVLLQQALNAAIAFVAFKVICIAAAIAFVAFKVTGSDKATSSPSSLATVSCQFLIAMFIHDTWQYFIHRAMHANKFLYRNFHSWHHRVIAPYAYAAQYNHFIDGFLTETVAATLAFAVSGMSHKTSIYFFALATIKGVDDHCGYMLPWNPFHLWFGNNAAYHEIHHQLAGNKCNFAQPFFVMWDKIFGTYVAYSLEKRSDGGYEARLVKDGAKSD